MDVLMPQLGETVAEGKIVKWFKQAGDVIRPGDNLFEIETDKTSMEVPATFGGTLSDIHFSVGDVAKVGAVVATIIGAGEPAQAKTVSPSVPQTPLTPAKAGVQKDQALGPRLRGDERADGSDATRNFSYPDMTPWREVRTPERNYGPARLPGGNFITPLARRLASERGIDLARVAGSGPHGRIVAADIAGAAPAIQAGSQGVPQINLVADIDVGRLLAMRDEANAHAPAMNDGTASFRLSLTDFIVKTWAATLHRAGIEGDIAVIVSRDGRALAPVIEDAQAKSLTALSHEIRALAAGPLDKAGQGGTSAVMVLDTAGIRELSAIVTPPHTTVLSAGGVRRAPVEAKDGSVRFISQVTVTLSCDRRAIDAARGAELLAALRNFMENPVTALV